MAVITISKKTIRGKIKLSVIYFPFSFKFPVNYGLCM